MFTQVGAVDDKFIWFLFRVIDVTISELTRKEKDQYAHQTYHADTAPAQYTLENCIVPELAALSW